MTAWQERVVAEKKELDERLGKLVAFLAGDEVEKVPMAEVSRLSEQEKVMRRYSQILGERIEGFPKETVDASGQGERLGA